MAVGEEDFVLCTIDKGEFEKEGPVTTFPTMSMTGSGCISSYLKNIIFNIEAENSFYDMKSKGKVFFEIDGQTSNSISLQIQLKRSQ